MKSATAMMKAVVLNKGEMQVKQVPIPAPKKNQIRVKLEGTGVCHTDVHIARGDISATRTGIPTKFKKDLILGHEGVGVVDLLGEDVKGFKIGDRVLIPWLGSTCGKCEQCICGQEELCCCRSATGADVDGTYAEYIAVDAKSIIALPASLTPSQASSLAPIACAGLTTYKALKQSGLRAGQWVALIGAAGGLGHLAFQYAEAMAFKVIAIDVGAEKMKFLQSMGAKHTIDASKTKNIEEAVYKLVKHGVKATLVLAPAAIAYEQAVSITQRGGTIVCVALPKDPVTMNMQNIIRKGLHVTGSLVGNRQDLREALDFAIEGKVRCVVAERPLEKAAEVHEELCRNAFEGRAVLRCGEGPCRKEGSQREEGKRQAGYQGA